MRSATSRSPANCTTAAPASPPACTSPSSTPIRARASKRRQSSTPPPAPRSPDSLRATYYQCYSLLYGHYAAISNQTRYDRLILEYEDSTRRVLDTASFEFRNREVLTPHRAGALRAGRKAALLAAGGGRRRDPALRPDRLRAGKPLPTARQRPAGPRVLHALGPRRRMQRHRRTPHSRRWPA